MIESFYAKLIEGQPKLKRGMVWCHACGTKRYVDSAHCLAYGWPKCPECGMTMSVDSPHERYSRLANRDSRGRFAKNVSGATS